MGRDRKPNKADSHGLSQHEQAEGRGVVVSIDGESTETPTGETLLDLLGKGSGKACITFAGQGIAYLDELKELYGRGGRVEALVSAATSELERLQSEQIFRWSGLYDGGVDLLDWIDGKEPSLAYLASSAISQPLIFLTQVCQFVANYEDGLKAVFEAQGIVSLTGHSQGMLPALLIAESSTGEVNTDRFLNYFQYMAWQGLFMAQSARRASAKWGEEGGVTSEATPMAAISGLEVERLQALVTKVNENLAADRQLVVSLQNTRSRNVVSGPPQSLIELQKTLESRGKKEAALKKAGRFAGTPLQANWEYLGVSAPFHSPHMQGGFDELKEVLEQIGFQARSRDLVLPVLSPVDGTLLNDAEDLTEAIMRAQFLEPVRWQNTLKSVVALNPVQYILDCGPGDAVSRLSYSAVKGTGVEVIALSTSGGKKALFTVEESRHKPVSYKDFLPQLVTLPEGQVSVSNRYTQATGHSPVILPGMTPTTVDVPIVAAAAQGGHTAELAGGGQVTEQIFWLRMEELKETLPPGVEVVFNGLFLDPYLWNLHVRQKGLVQKAKKAGYPLCGVTISAGLPEVDEAVELLDEFAESGLWLNAFKPGTVAQVKQVVKIARAASHHTIFVHLEGGKAGGHHSWEDLDQLLLSTYHQIRQEPNLVLCVGGGIATESRATDLITGRWARQYDQIDMPVDAIFLGTLAMACKEATTSPQVKKALVNVTGTEQWVFDGDEEGGVTSGKSSLNADIHYLDNPASRCGRLLDLVAGDEDAVSEKREEIINALNQTAKPYFGELSEMTYCAVLERMVSLMASGNHGRYEDGCWPDISYRQRVADFIFRAEARLHGQQTGEVESVLSNLNDLDDPMAVTRKFSETYSNGARITLHPVDVDYFIFGVCARPGKPVCFVPSINADVRKWYKGDSLWQAHDDRFEADQVLIIPGPEAVAGICKADEPVKELLDRFHHHVIQTLESEGVKSRLSDTVCQAPSQGHALDGIERVEQGRKLILNAIDPTSTGGWLGFVGEQYKGPIAALFNERSVYFGKEAEANPIVSLCRAERGASLVARIGKKKALESVTYTPRSGIEESVKLTRKGEDILLEMAVGGIQAEDTKAQYRVLFKRHLCGARQLFVVDPDEQREALRTFYHRSIFGRSIVPVSLFETATCRAVVEARQAEAYAAVTGSPAINRLLPMNMSFSLVWEALFRTLSCDELSDGLLRLVHLDNQISIGPEWPLISGETVAVEARVVSVEDGDNGRQIETFCTVKRSKKLAVTVRSTFFVRGAFRQTPYVLRRQEEVSTPIWLEDMSAVQFLREQDWVDLVPGFQQENPGDLIFKGLLAEEQTRGGVNRYSARGPLYQGEVEVGQIDLEVSGSALIHPLKALQEVLGKEKGDRVDTPRRTLAEARDFAPSSMVPFAEVSRDLNPIHRSVLSARLAGLEGPIVHGMWTAARLHGFLVAKLVSGDWNRIIEYKAAFMAPTMPGESLRLEVVRTGVSEGRLQVEATAFAVRESGEVPVVRAQALIKPERTAYIFPGQGIQKQGMGMEGYGRSAAARQVWDQADAYTREALGFSILRVVKENPKEMLIDGVPQRHPQGILNLTQFTQTAMAVLANAQVAEMREAGVLIQNAITCGHSVGEYNALGAIIEVLPLESIVEIVYHRGLVMHQWVARDAEGESGYRMGVIRPHYAGMTHEDAEALVDQIGKETGEFIQIVNYNVMGRQYSVTGRIAALNVLEERLIERAVDEKKAPYIEVPGIDVPFHSEVLRNGVSLFRETLEERLPEIIDPDRLVNNYIPNLTATPFRIDRNYIEEVYGLTQSEVLKTVLAQFGAHEKDPVALTRVLLIELLAWQFSSPVRWIESQDVMFRAIENGGMGVKQVLEIGVGYQPTLANMAKYTLTLMGNSAGSVEVLNIESDAEQVFYQDEDPALVIKEEGPSETGAGEAAESEQPQAVAVPVTAPVSAVSVEDVNPTATEVLQVVLALQGKVRLDQLDNGETIDELFGGNSSRRNQVLLDIGNEFQLGTIDGAHERPLSALAEEIEKRCARYSAPGSYIRAAQDDAIKRAFGRAGMMRKEIENYLSATFGLGSGLIGGLYNALVLETRTGDSARGGALGVVGDAAPANKGEAQEVLDKVVASFAAHRGIALNKQSQKTGGGASVDAAVVQELESRIIGEQGVIMNNLRDLADRLGHQLFAEGEGLSQVDETEELLSTLMAELGDEFDTLISPRFDQRRHVTFNSIWSSAQRDLGHLFYRGVNGQITHKEMICERDRLSIHSDDARLRATAGWYAAQARKSGSNDLQKVFKFIADGKRAKGMSLQPKRPALTISDEGTAHYEEVVSSQEGALGEFVSGLWPSKGRSLVSIGESGAYNKAFKRALTAAVDEGFDFTGKTALVTGASPDSIAVESVKHMLRGGARVVVTTTSYNRKRLQFYRALYQQEAGPGAELHVVPFNQACFADIDQLVDWLFSEVSEQAGGSVRILKRPFHPDIVLPFGAIKDLATMDSLGTRAQVALRAMLLGVERLMAGIAVRYLAEGLPRESCHVVLPMSPNHGGFGGDGAYAETKAALEVLLNKWRSEHHAWGKALTICGARIGWVRGTGLMDANNPVAARLEEQTGVRTFSNGEMGLLIAGLCARTSREMAKETPLLADLTGGFAEIEDIRSVVEGIRQEIESEVSTKRRMTAFYEETADLMGSDGAAGSIVTALPNWPMFVAPAGERCTGVKGQKTSSPDPRETVVIVGMGEVGPFGSARTRFQWEVEGRLSPAAVLELAWVTGLVRFEESGRGGAWVDDETGEEVSEDEIFNLYEEKVKERSGIRFIEPEVTGFVSDGVPVLTPVFLERDFVFPASNEAEARSFLEAEPENTRVHYDESRDSWMVTRFAGTEIRVPRKGRLKSQVAGQVPTGFDLTRYGVPKEMVDSVDRVALFNLIATAEAFISAGMTPEDLLNWIHPARVANTQGAGIGGMASLRRLYLDFVLDNERQGDTLQETLINVMAAYVVQNYVGSYGAMSHPVGACATAAVSLEEAYDKIKVDKADFVVSGGYDDVGREGLIGFGDMNATVESDDMLKMGLEPDQMSRANDIRRRGFVSAQGGGTLLVTRGDLALELGLPIYGILAYTGSFGDGIQVSIPAPGMGALSAASGGIESPIGKALAQYDLTTDDIALVYKHDTSTNANDPNENSLHSRIQSALGRTSGNPLWVVSQKTVTGHSKGGAAAWQSIGLCQSMLSGVIPGNRNLECVDEKMRQFEHMAFTDQTLRAGPAESLKAGLLTSLGFGHVSALALILHPDCLINNLDASQRKAYLAQVMERQAQSLQLQTGVQMGRAQHFEKRTFRRFNGQDGSEEQENHEAAVLLDRNARLDLGTGKYCTSEGGGE
jgi:3-oxoacyl-ACP reductase-like protein/enoyl reductase-like protein/acyl dehydratase